MATRSKFGTTFLRVVLTVAVLIAISSAYAQQGEDLREAAQNPIADLISVPFQNNTNFDIGRSENTQNVLNFQPVYPLHLNQSWNLITRPILPVISAANDKKRQLEELQSKLKSPPEPVKFPANIDLVVKNHDKINAAMPPVQ